MTKCIQLIKFMISSCILICVCLLITACAGNANVTEADDNAKISVSEKASGETTVSQESTRLLDSSNTETVKSESVAQSESSNESKPQYTESIEENKSTQQEISYSNDKITFIFKDNSGNTVDGIDVVIQPHANESSTHTDIAEIVGISDNNGIVTWKPIIGKHFLEATKGTENQEYAINISESDIGSVIELTW